MLEIGPLSAAPRPGFDNGPVSEAAWRTGAAVRAGTATALGSMPGGDPLETARVLAGELPQLMPLPELPARGVGADIVLASDTKALSGHSDLLMGHVSVRDADLAERLDAVFPLRGYTLLAAGDDPKALRKLLGKQFRKVVCE